MPISRRGTTSTTARTSRTTPRGSCDVRKWTKLTCDWRLVEQNVYSSWGAQLRALGFANNRSICISGGHFGDGNTDPVAKFLTYNHSTVSSMVARNVVLAVGARDYTGLIVMDLERTAAPSKFAKYSTSFLWQVVSVILLRVSVTREFFPCAKLAVYGTGISDTAQLRAFERAGTLGLWDELDYLIPSFYLATDNATDSEGRGVKVAPNVSTAVSVVEASLQLTTAFAQRHKSLKGLAPFLSWIYLGRQDRQQNCAVPLPLIRAVLAAVSRANATKIVHFWAGDDEEKTSRHCHGGDPAHDITQLDWLQRGKLVPSRCVKDRLPSKSDDESSGEEEDTMTFGPGDDARVRARSNVFPPQMLGFGSFRGAVLVAAPGVLVALSTGRCSWLRCPGGDVSGRSLLVRRSLDAGLQWDPPRFVANASALTLKAGDGVYLGAAVYHEATKRVLVFWGMCMEKCRADCHTMGGKEGRSCGTSIMSAPSYMLTASSDGFGTWAHTNLTRLCDSPRLSWFFPRAFMDNAAVVLNNGQLLLAGDFHNSSRDDAYAHLNVSGWRGVFTLLSSDGGRVRVLSLFVCVYAVSLT